MAAYLLFRITLYSVLLTSSLICMEHQEECYKNLITFKSSDNKYFTITPEQASIFGIMEMLTSFENTAMDLAESLNKLDLGCDKTELKSLNKSQGNNFFGNWLTPLLKYFPLCYPQTSHAILADKDNFDDDIIPVPFPASILSVIIEWANMSMNPQCTYRTKEKMKHLGIKYENKTFGSLIEIAYFLRCPIILNSLAYIAAPSLLKKIKHSPENLRHFLRSSLPESIADDFFRRIIKQILYHENLMDLHLPYNKMENLRYELLKKYLSVHDLVEDANEILDKSKLPAQSDQLTLFDFYSALDTDNFEMQFAIRDDALRQGLLVIDKALNLIQQKKFDYDKDSFDAWFTHITDPELQKDLLGELIKKMSYRYESCKTRDEAQNILLLFRHQKPGFLKMILRLCYFNLHRRQKKSLGINAEEMDDIHIRAIFEENGSIHSEKINLCGVIKHANQSVKPFFKIEYRRLPKPYPPCNHGYTFQELNAFITILPIMKIWKRDFWIDLSYNNLVEIPEEIFLRDNLTHLNFSHNKLARVPPHIHKLKNLRHLSLKNNNLTELPEEMGALQKLKKIKLKGNKLLSLPNSILNHPKLKTVFEAGLK